MTEHEPLKDVGCSAKLAQKHLSVYYLSKILTAMDYFHVIIYHVISVSRCRKSHHSEDGDPWPDASSDQGDA